jgi:hypothetical protein
MKNDFKIKNKPYLGISGTYYLSNNTNSRPLFLIKYSRDYPFNAVGYI